MSVNCQACKAVTSRLPTQESFQEVFLSAGGSVSGETEELFPGLLNNQVTHR